MHADRDRSEPPDIIVPSGHCWQPRQHEPHLFGDPPDTKRCDGSPVVIDTEHDVRAEPPLTISRSDPIFGGAFEPAASDADRVNTYAEAYYGVRDADRFGEPDGDSIARAVIAVADREQATLLAKIAELSSHEQYADLLRSATKDRLRAEAAETKVAELTAENERPRERVVLADQGAWKSTATSAERALADERAKVARVEALCAVMEARKQPVLFGGYSPPQILTVADVRAALAGPAEPESRIVTLPADPYDEGTAWEPEPEAGETGGAS